MKTFVKIICFVPKCIVLGFVWIYSKCISPFLPHTCVFSPTCSVYMKEAVKKFGGIKGTFLGIKRICRCLPNAKIKFDPVPENIKGDYKWLI